MACITPQSSHHFGCRDLQQENYKLRKALKECSSKTNLLLEQYRTEQEQKTAMKQLIRQLQSKLEEAQARCVDALEEASSLRDQLGLALSPGESSPALRKDRVASQTDSPLDVQLRRMHLPLVAERRGAVSYESPSASAPVSAFGSQENLFLLPECYEPPASSLRSKSRQKPLPTTRHRSISLDTTRACQAQAITMETLELSPLSTAVGTSVYPLDESDTASSDSDESYQDSALDSSTTSSVTGSEFSPISEPASSQDWTQHSRKLKPAKRLPHPGTAQPPSRVNLKPT